MSGHKRPEADTLEHCRQQKKEANIAAGNNIINDMMIRNWGRTIKKGEIINAEIHLVLI